MAQFPTDGSETPAIEGLPLGEESTLANNFSINDIRVGMNSQAISVKQPPGASFEKFCGHFDCLVSAAMLEKCFGNAESIPPRFLVLKFLLSARPLHLPTGFTTHALPKIFVHDVVIDRISMWNSSEPLDLYKFAALTLGRDYRLPGAYEIELHLHSVGEEEMIVSPSITGCFWHGWWDEKDARLRECLDDLRLLQRDVLKEVATEPVDDLNLSPHSIRDDESHAR